jgi:diguanylate cyclase (GGDEF)-like protein
MQSEISPVHTDADTTIPVTTPDEERAAYEAQIVDRELSDCYLSSLLMLGRFAAEVYPPVGQGVHETMLRLRRRLAFDPQHRGLADTHQVVEALMRDFGRRAKEALDRRTAESDYILQMSSLASDLMAARDRSYLEQFREALRRLQNAVARTDRSGLPGDVERTIGLLKNTIAGYQEDAKLARAQFEQEIEEFERRRNAEHGSTTLDPATGLYNRAEIQRRIKIAMRVNQQFSLLKLQVHDFSALNDQLGEAGENLLMKLVCERLTDQVRPRDVVGRWNARAFVMMFLNCPVVNAEIRAGQISKWLSDLYRVETKDGVVVAEVQVTATATELQPGESPEDFAGRADALSPMVGTRSR